MNTETISSDTATKRPWFSVACPEAGTTGYRVVEGDPINGRLIGHYADIHIAHYVAKLHNMHISTDPVLREVDLMFQSEIHFGVDAVWDGGINWYLGTGAPNSGFGDASLRGNKPTMEEALAEMVNAARQRYLDSTFARLHACDITPRALEDHPSIGELGSIVAAKHGSFSLHFEEGHTYDDPSWTLTLESDPTNGWGGYTAEEALRAASINLSQSN